MSSSITLELIAKSSPPPYGPLALAYYLESFPNSRVAVSFVHSLKDGANAILDVHGTQVFGQDAIVKKLGDLFAAQGLCGKDQNDSAQIAALLILPPALPPSFPTATAFLALLEQQLTLRTFLVSHSISLADWALWGAVRNNSIARAQLGQFAHVSRWYNHISQLAPAVRAVEEIAIQGKIKPVKEKKDKSDEPKTNATFDLGLPNAKMGEVVTRFPPEPSGYLHIGHAKAAILNQYFAKIYKGKFLIRFDDTNPSKEKAEFEESIIEDLAMLGVKGEKITYTSDYFDQLHQLCIRMIQEGNAYADDTDQETMRKERWDGIASARRDMSPADSLAHFAEMATGGEAGLKWCIRAKISFTDPNKAMRDPVIYRGNPLPHHRTGDKFKVYPTYDFACPIVDCLEGVTHALRTNEYRDRNPQYQWMLDALKLRKVEVWDFGRINFVYTLLSKRKLKWFVEEGYVRGWDDPRFATVRGIRRRGMTIDALNQYMLLQGPSQAFTNLEWDVIWNINKKVIDPIAPRFVALEKKDLVKVTVRGPGTPAVPESRSLPKHKKNPDVGTKETIFADVIYVDQKDAQNFAQDEEITLMDWGNAFVRKITGSPIVESLEVELNLTGDFKKTKQKITWLATSPSAPLTPALLLDYDYLITKKGVEKDDELVNLITPVTEFETEAVADANVKLLKKGDVIQFERIGYFIVDKVYGEPAHDKGRESVLDRVELILIPDGKASSVASKASPEEVVPAAAAPAGGKAKKDAPKKEGAAPKKEAKKAAPAGPAKLPETAPLEAVETILLSEGTKGFAQPVKTKMFKVDSLYGDVDPKAKTDMFTVKSIYDI